MRSLIFYSLLILALPQALKMRRTTLRLPVAKGPASGVIPCANSQNPLHILHIGESTVTGVGVVNMHEGFTCQLARHLSAALQRPTHWQAIGYNGAKAGDLRGKVKTDACADIILITLGVNDVTGLTSRKKWQRDLKKLMAEANPQGTARIFFTQVPNMARFPALPRLLAKTLGLRSHMLNKALASLCKNSGAGLLTTQADFSAELMAEDGYHPNARGYAHWAASIAEQLKNAIK